MSETETKTFYEKIFFCQCLNSRFNSGCIGYRSCLFTWYLARGTQPGQVLRFIASGVFGKEAANGNMMIVWGLLFHFLIAITFTFFFFLLVRLVPALVKYPIPIAILYGIFVWLFMRYVVLNYISTIKIRSLVGEQAIINALIAAGILIVCIGLPNALLARKYVRANKLT